MGTPVSLDQMNAEDNTNGGVGKEAYKELYKLLGSHKILIFLIITGIVITITGVIGFLVLGSAKKDKDFEPSEAIIISNCMITEQKTILECSPRIK